MNSVASTGKKLDVYQPSKPVGCGPFEGIKGHGAEASSHKSSVKPTMKATTRPASKNVPKVPTNKSPAPERPSFDKRRSILLL